MQQTAKVSWFTLFTASLLVAGNVLGVGLLALPIKLGVSGYIPSVIDIVLICAVMVVSGFVIADRLPENKEYFDIPSFFHQELGHIGEKIAIICNLILLYGVLVAYLSGISSIFGALFDFKASQTLIITAYFLFASSFIIFGQTILRRGNTLLLFLIFCCFFVLIYSGSAHFNHRLLEVSHWKYLPLGLPIIVSVFHFHNVIPTIANFVDKNAKKLRLAITIGVVIGLIMNLTWVTVVLGTLPQASANHNSVVYAFLHNLPATVPMTRVLNSKLFTTAGLVFALLAVTASYVANGAGLYGFMRDLVYNFSRRHNKMAVGLLAFIPPLVITIIYPHIFLSALDIVGGVGETILFVILPGLILAKIHRTIAPFLTKLGLIIATIGLFILIFVICQKLGITHLRP